MSTGLPGTRARMNIKALRERLGASQEDLANDLHVDVRTIRRWESGSASPSPMAIAHLHQLRARHQNEAQGSEAGAGAQADATAPATPRRRMPVL